MKIRKSLGVLAAALVVFGAVGVTAQQVEAPEKTEATAAVSGFEGAIPASSVSREMIGQEVVVSGTVISTRASNRDNIPNQLTVGEGGNSALVIVYWPDVAPQIEGNSGIAAAGTKVLVRGQLSDYKGTLQVRVKSPKQIMFEGAPAPAPATAAGVAAGTPALPPADKEGYYTVEQLPLLGAIKGQEISVRGKVASYKASWSETAPNVVSIDEGGVEAEVVFWPVEGIETPDFSEPGTPVFATGKLQDYRGRVQVKIDALSNVSKEPLSADKIAHPHLPGPKVTSIKEGWPGHDKSEKYLEPAERVKVADNAPMPLREIGPKYVDNIVTVKGKIERVIHTEDGWHILLSAPQGQARVNLASEEMASKAVPGAEVELRCKVVYSEKRHATELDYVGNKE